MLKRHFVNSHHICHICRYLYLYFYIFILLGSVIPPLIDWIRYPLFGIFSIDIIAALWYMVSPCFLSHTERAKVVASPICWQKTWAMYQRAVTMFYTYHTLEKWFYWHFVVIFGWIIVSGDLFAVRLWVLLGQWSQNFLLHVFTF